MAITIMDGPLGTELTARGVAAPAPGWSAYALTQAPQIVSDIHRDYAAAGAQVHTANTFRTQVRHFPDDWRQRLDLAVRLVRGAVPGGQRVAGSIAALEDCYSPWLSPSHPRAEHRQQARALAAAGVDLLLLETFPHVGEALVAAEEAVATGLPTWFSLTPGPTADLLSPEEVCRGAALAVDLGVQAVLVNCLPAAQADRWLLPLIALGLPVPVGTYANAGHVCDGLGWGAGTDGARRYADLAAGWAAAGATLIGGCCGTGPATIAAMAARLSVRSD